MCWIGAGRIFKEALRLLTCTTGWMEMALLRLESLEEEKFGYVELPHRESQSAPRYVCVSRVAGKR